MMRRAIPDMTKMANAYAEPPQLGHDDGQYDVGLDFVGHEMPPDDGGGR